MFAPQKNRAGQRTYRRRDVEMALRIKELLYDEKYTIAGAKQKLSSDMRGVNRENGMSARPKAPRSLQPPPSLAAKFKSSQSAEHVVEDSKPRASPGDDRRATLREIAKELREILDMLDESEPEIADRMSEEL